MKRASRSPEGAAALTVTRAELDQLIGCYAARNAATPSEADSDHPLLIKPRVTDTDAGRRGNRYRKRIRTRNGDCFDPRAPGLHFRCGLQMARTTVTYRRLHDYEGGCDGRPSAKLLQLRPGGVLLFQFCYCLGARIESPKCLTRRGAALIYKRRRSTTTSH